VAVVQVLAIVLVVLIFTIPMGLRLWALLRHRGPGRDADPDLVQRWAAHLYRMDRED
jgi:hypothetical protein